MKRVNMKPKRCERKKVSEEEEEHTHKEREWQQNKHSNPFNNTMNNRSKNQNKQKSLERKITQLEEKQADLEYQMYQSNDQEIIIGLQKEIKKVKQEIDTSFETLMSITD